ncbi:MAG: AI-2E family transporter [Tannerella sp.]|jgi:predicted PurR-regulated permease PerM|nr:AI-2E family transporter [Tannerella sp.]
MKEKYFRYSLIALILILGWLVVSGLWSFVNGLLGAFTLYVLVRGQMKHLTETRKMKSVFAAMLILLEVVACVFVPLYFLVWVLIERIQDVNVDVSESINTIKHFIALIQEKTGYDVLNINNIETATTYVTRALQVIISQVSGLVITTVVMVFLLYFMLISRKSMESYAYSLLPFNEDNKHTVMGEIHNMVRSNAIGIPLLAIIQGLVALIGYWAAGVPSPVLFGVLTAFSTIIPIVGTGIVWFPLVVYMALMGNWVAAVGLLIYCVVILTNIDNVIRFILQKKLADTHPLITVFGVILGLKIFGFWGVIFGPLLMSMFFLLVNIFKKEYLDSDK